MKKLLLISNSTMVGKPYLEYALPYLQKFLHPKKTPVVFIPYAGVTFSYDNYEKKVNDALRQIQKKVVSIHRFANPREVIDKAGVIMVGGGNTWKLLKVIQQQNLLEIITQKAQIGTPYVGWSAGANLACPTIKTTNDMPIVELASFQALNLVPFQINPHYFDSHPKGHGGETREDRINEFLEMNKNSTVVGLREGTMLWVEGENITLHGSKPCRIFSYGNKPQEKEGLLSSF